MRFMDIIEERAMSQSFNSESYNAIVRVKDLTLNLLSLFHEAKKDQRCVWGVGGGVRARICLAV